MSPLTTRVRHIRPRPSQLSDRQCPHSLTGFLDRGKSERLTIYVCVTATSRTCCPPAPASIGRRIRTANSHKTPPWTRVGGCTLLYERTDFPPMNRFLPLFHLSPPSLHCDLSPRTPCQASQPAAGGRAAQLRRLRQRPAPRVPTSDRATRSWQWRAAAVPDAQGRAAAAPARLAAPGQLQCQVGRRGRPGPTGHSPVICCRRW